MKHKLDKISRELRLRIKKQILNPLEILEQIPQNNSTSSNVINEVFKDFKKVNNKIWDEVIQRIKK